MPAGEQTNGKPRPRVVIADDNADMRQYAVRLLAEPYQVRAVSDGAAALAAAAARHETARCGGVLWLRPPT